MSAARPGARSTRLLAAGSLLLATALAGCIGTDDGEHGTGHGAGTPEAAASSGDPSVTVLQPGKPGESASVVDPGTKVADAGWNHADAAFMQMMIPHHAQALQMSELAVDRAEDPRVLKLADRIHAAQLPEIMTMAAWLDAREMEVPRAADDPHAMDHSAHGHDGMAGMLTPDQMDALEAAEGEEFDRLFLDGMIGHHEGALEMADTATTQGVDQQVSEMSADVAASQAAEIARMEDLLRDL